MFAYRILPSLPCWQLNQTHLALPWLILSSFLLAGLLPKRHSVHPISIAIACLNSWAWSLVTMMVNQMASRQVAVLFTMPWHLMDLMPLSLKVHPKQSWSQCMWVKTTKPSCLRPVSCFHWHPGASRLVVRCKKTTTRLGRSSRINSMAKFNKKKIVLLKRSRHPVLRHNTFFP